MDPYAMGQAAPAQAAPAAPAAPGAWGGDAANWGMPPAGQWGAPAPTWDATAAAGAAWGGAAPAWGGFGAPAPWGGDAWGGKGGKGGMGGMGPGKGGKGGPGGKGMGMRFQPYAKKAGPTCSIKVQPLPEGFGQKELGEAFSSHGEIQSIRVMQGEPNYAYVNFATTAAAASAIALNQIDLGGTKCFINPGKPKYPDATDGIGLFNLPYSTTQEQLDKLLGAYAGFKKVKMINKPGTTEFRGFAFADFDTVDNAIVALEGLTGSWVGDKAIDVKFSSMSSEQRQGGWGKGKGKGGDQWGGPPAWGAPAMGGWGQPGSWW